MLFWAGFGQKSKNRRFPRKAQKNKKKPPSGEREVVEKESRCLNCGLNSFAALNLVSKKSSYNKRAFNSNLYNNQEKLFSDRSTGILFIIKAN